MTDYRKWNKWAEDVSDSGSEGGLGQVGSAFHPDMFYPPVHSQAQNEKVDSEEEATDDELPALVSDVEEDEDGFLDGSARWQTAGVDMDRKPGVDSRAEASASGAMRRGFLASNKDNEMDDASSDDELPELLDTSDSDSSGAGGSKGQQRSAASGRAAPPSTGSSALRRGFLAGSKGSKGRKASKQPGNGSSDGEVPELLDSSEDEALPAAPPGRGPLAQKAKAPAAGFAAGQSAVPIEEVDSDSDDDEDDDMPALMDFDDSDDDAGGEAAARPSKPTAAAKKLRGGFFNSKQEKPSTKGKASRETTEPAAKGAKKPPAVKRPKAPKAAGSSDDDMPGLLSDSGSDSGPEASSVQQPSRSEAAGQNSSGSSARPEQLLRQEIQPQDAYDVVPAMVGSSNEESAGGNTAAPAGGQLSPEELAEQERKREKNRKRREKRKEQKRKEREAAAADEEMAEAIAMAGELAEQSEAMPASNSRFSMLDGLDDETALAPDAMANEANKISKALLMAAKARNLQEVQQQVEDARRWLGKAAIAPSVSKVRSSLLEAVGVLQQLSGPAGSAVKPIPPSYQPPTLVAASTVIPSLHTPQVIPPKPKDFSVPEQASISASMFTPAEPGPEVLPAGLRAWMERLNQERDIECVICMDNSRSQRFEPCGHEVVCAPCGNKLMRNVAAPKCPVCRGNIKKMRPMLA